MKKGVLAVLLAVIMVGSMAMGAFAYDREWHGNIRDRVNQEYQRIERGIERGSLTRPEAHRLRKELDHIMYKIDRMRDDGHLDYREREIINRDLDRLHWDITREKRDGQGRY